MRAPASIAACLVLAVLAAGAAGAAPLRWSRPVTLPGSYGVFSIACPSSDLCVAGTAGNLLVSTDPTGGAAAWLPSAVAPQRGGLGGAIRAVSCPSVRLCVAVSSSAVLTSTRPAGGARAWRTARLPIPPGWHLEHVACDSTSACVAVALSSRSRHGTAAPRDGVVAVSSDPAGGPGAWRVQRLRDVADFAYCLARECALATEDGDVLIARHPAAGPRAWHSVHEIGKRGRATFIPALACSSVRSCLAPLGGERDRGEIRGSLTSRRAFSWRYTQGFGGARSPAPSGASCAPGICAFAATIGSGRGAYGEVLTASRLGGPWSVTRYPATRAAVVSCASASFCVAGGIEQQLGGCRPRRACAPATPTGVVVVGRR